MFMPSRLNSHASGVGEPLAERPGGGLDAERQVVLRVSRGLAAKLTEALDVSQRQRIAGQVQHRVQQHRAVAVREYEAVAVQPGRIGGVVAQVVAPQHLGNVGHTHRHAGMTGIGALYRVHGECADGVGEFAACAHEGALQLLRGGAGRWRRSAALPVR
jgi:hypothetical protein